MSKHDELKNMSEHTDHLGDANKLLREFRECLPQEVHANQFTLHSKNPFKAMVLREALVHRITWLAEGAVSEFAAQRWIPATVLVRAIAVLHSLFRKVGKAISTRDDAELTEFLRRTMVGSRTDPELPQMVNVLTMIEKVDEDYPRFKASYETLSEYAHPNWCGVLGAFSELDRENLVTRFRPREALHNASLLTGYLEVAKGIYNDVGSRIAELSLAFDRGDLRHPDRAN
jgi:hypothetical protein